MTATHTASFDYIGRKHAVAALPLKGERPNDWAAQIRRYALTHLGSRSVDVHLEQESPDDPITGVVIAGWRTVGIFTISEDTA